MVQLALVVLLVAGCAETTTPPRSAPLAVASSETGAPSEPAETPTSADAPATQAEFVVAGKDGVFVLDGTENRRRVGKVADAAAPRFLPGRHAIVFLHANVELVELDLETGADRVVAGPWPSALECPGMAPVALELQTDQDVTLDAAGRHVCIELLDRNLNMASFAVSVRADLLEHTFRLWRRFGCGAAETAEEFACDADVKPASVPPEQAYAFDEKAGAFRSASGDVFGRFAEWAVNAVSPNGRWLVLWGNVEQGDYIHFNLLVADLLTGTLLPVPEQIAGTKTAWPAELTRDELEDPSRKRLGTRAGDYVWESGVRFVDADVLVAGELLLLLAERRVIELGGDLAR